MHERKMFFFLLSIEIHIIYPTFATISNDKKAEKMWKKNSNIPILI